jgi:hypothetical protein
MSDEQPLIDLAPLVITPQMAAAVQAQQPEAPLSITPQMAAAVQAQPAAAPQEQPAAAPQEQPAAAPAGTGGAVDQLKAMFPDYDTEVLSSVLAIQEGNVEMAVQQLLEMGDADAPPPTDAMLAGNIDSDEELAMQLFRQFADEMGPQLGVSVPDNVRNDPERYEAFVREHFERELARPDSQVTARANQALESNQTLRNQFEQRGGRQGFLERMKAAVGGGGRAQVSVVAVEQGTQSLLANDYHGNSASGDHV